MIYGSLAAFTVGWPKEVLAKVQLMNLPSWAIKDACIFTQPKTQASLSDIRRYTAAFNSREKLRLSAQILIRTNGEAER